ncbi:membrane protein [Mesobacillus campisalis]|uniref:Membrane protein n=1 Tax=Mesobacillus campisalis TaxID=1408103 RepID=A0A0M2T336_9BACI|nr:YetF domain-containing protein [Mesobacillus campisalis]KKK39230.1 membrane protein [Mesobacillus campisalis]
MDFAQGQETLTLMEWILRAVVSYFFIVVVARALGQRAISQLRLLDFVMALIIGNIIAHPLSDEKLGLKGSVITTTVLVALYLISIFIILKWPLVRKLVNQTPIKIVQNGEIIHTGLKKARISIDVLLEELRKEKVTDVNKVALALWEAEGRISFFLDPKYEPLTPSTCQIDVEPFDFPRTIIKEGRIMEKELQQTHKDAEWVISKLEMAFQTEVKNVLLATLDRKDNLKVFLYK